MNDPKRDAAWHGTETTQPKPTAADVLRAHQYVRPAFRDPRLGPAIVCTCDAVVNRHVTEVSDAVTTFRHQADMLAAAGLLATAEHDAQVAAQALRDAAQDIGHAPGCHPDPDRDPYVGCECRISLIYARADRIAGGAT